MKPFLICDLLREVKSEYPCHATNIQDNCLGIDWILVGSEKIIEYVEHPQVRSKLNTLSLMVRVKMNFLRLGHIPSNHHLPPTTLAGHSVLYPNNDILLSTYVFWVG